MCATFTMRKRTTSWRDEADRAALVRVRERYGAARERDAIRLAWRLLAESKRVSVEVEPPAKRKPHPTRE
jgi:hypothetical protein